MANSLIIIVWNVNAEIQATSVIVQMNTKDIIIAAIYYPAGKAQNEK